MISTFVQGSKRLFLITIYIEVGHRWIVIMNAKATLNNIALKKRFWAKFRNFIRLTFRKLENFAEKYIVDT